MVISGPSSIGGCGGMAYPDEAEADEELRA